MSYESTEDRIERMENKTAELISILRGMVGQMKAMNTDNLAYLELFLAQYQQSLIHHKVLSLLLTGHIDKEKLNQILAVVARAETQMDFIQASIARRRAAANNASPNSDSPPAAQG